MKKLKKILALGISLWVACGIAACGGPLEEFVEEQKQLVLWHYWDLPYARERLGAMVAGFNDLHPDVKISLRYVPDEDFKKQLSLAMADGIMPDIVLMDSSDVQFFNATGYLEDVTDLITTADYLDVAIASCLSTDGRLKGLPIGVNSLAFFYNETLLNQAGLEPPETLDEFIIAAEKLSVGDVYGCAFPSLQSEESLFCFLPILWAEGGDIKEINSIEGKRAFEVLQRLSRQGAMSPSTVNMTLGDVAREFEKGKIGMMFTTTMSAQSMENSHSEYSFRMGHLPVSPKAISVVGGEVLTITKGKCQNEAREFLRYMADPERIKLYIDGMGYMSPRKDVLDWQIENNPSIQAQVEILHTARTRDFTSDWPQISLAIAEAINKVILREDTPETIDDLAKKINEIRGGKE